MKTFIYNSQTKTFSESIKEFSLLDTKLARLAKLNEKEDKITKKYKELREKNGELTDEQYNEKTYQLELINIERDAINSMIKLIKEHNK